MNEEDDPRFSVIYTDPKFRKLPKWERKVKIDKRFRGMFTDKKFKVQYSVDKRGRPFKSSTVENLKKFYSLDKSEGDSSSQEEEEKEIDKKKKEKVLKSDQTSSSSEEFTGEENEAPDLEDDSLNADLKDEAKKGILSSSVQQKLKNLSFDYARGKCNLFSESSSDEPETEDSESETEVDHKWGELDNDAERGDETTSRLAVCNMDWDRIRAEDLMVLFHSFLPPEGVIHSVTIYPSEFGLKRIAEEEVNGPTELVAGGHVDSASADLGSSSDEDEEGRSYHRELLRQYQLNRLKYYYAVIVFDSPQTADKIYKECDNLEYESSATRLDLRFIPDGETFEQEPKDICEKLPELTKYKPRYFTTTALQQAKVELTWDETDPCREEFAQKITEAVKQGDVKDSDIENYVALTSGSEDENEQEQEKKAESKNEDVSSYSEDPITRYKNLLKEIDLEEAKKGNVQLEITWGSGPASSGQLKEDREVIDEVQEDGDADEDSEEEEEEEAEKSSSGKTDQTPFQKFLERRKEKKKAKKKQRKAKLKGDNDSSSEIGQSLNDESGSEIGEDVDSKVAAKNLKQKKLRKNKKKQHEESENSETERQKGELELLLMDENGAADGRRHFSLKKIKEKESKRKRRKLKEKLREKNANGGGKEQVENFQVNVKDSRFEALYSSHLYNIDPADPKFHRTKGMEAFIEEKQKRRANQTLEANNEVPAKKAKNTNPAHALSSELSALVKSVKTKTTKR